MRRSPLICGPLLLVVVECPIAGHAMGPPGIGTNLSLGGTLSANAQASQDAYQRLRAFLRMHLGEFSTQ